MLPICANTTCKVIIMCFGQNNFVSLVLLYFVSVKIYITLLRREQVRNQLKMLLSWYRCLAHQYCQKIYLYESTFQY